MTTPTTPDYLANLRAANAEMAINQKALTARYAKTAQAFYKIGLGENIILSLDLGDDYNRIVAKNDAEVARLMAKKDAEVVVCYEGHLQEIAKHNKDVGFDLRKRPKTAMTFEAFAKKFGNIPLPR